MKNPIKISKLQSVPISKVWKGEATDFTPWLALDENLEQLGDEVDIKLVLEAVEQRVGNFYADIVCRDAEDNTIVLIENQTKPTDHRHLGQICTYAGQLKASKIIWIAESIREEHREAIEWLNTISSDDISFYAVQVRAWRIENSPPAPSFDVVARPQLLSRQARKDVKRVSNAEISDTKQKWTKYWSEFIELAAVTMPSITSRVPYQSNWQTVASRSGLMDGYIEYNVYASSNNVRAEAYIGGASAKLIFHALSLHKDDIEHRFGDELTWEERPEKKGSKILSCLEGASVDFDKGRYEQQQWLATTMTKLLNAIQPFEDKLDFDAIAEMLDGDEDVV